MAEYKVRRLFKIGTESDSEIPESHESMWAYSVQYPGADHRTPGRFRIRITRMTAAEFISMMGGDPSDSSPEGYSIQGFVEKWTNNGWIHCLDWMGNPEVNLSEIEEDLLSMFQAFTTGEPVDRDWVAPSNPPPRPKRNEAKDIKPKPFTVIEGDKKKSDVAQKKTDTSDPGFDWI